MSDTDLLRQPGDASPWTPRVLALLREWNDRAGATAETHYAIAARLGRLNVRLGIPVVVLTTFVGTSVFATLERHVDLSLKILIGTVSVLAAVLASLQTFNLDRLRRRMDRVAAQSPEMGDRAWSRAEERYGLTYRVKHDAGTAEVSHPG